MILKKVFSNTLFILIAVSSPFIFSESADPFSGRVEVEEGENVINWEEGIFGNVLKKKEKKDAKKQNGVDKEPEKELTAKENKKTKKEKETNETPDAQNISKADTELADTELKKDEYGKGSSEWGRYYGENIKIERSEKFVAVEKKNDKTSELDEKPVTQNEEPFMFPIDLLLWGHGGDGYHAMINTGVKVSYWNVYSILSVGTDFSTVSARPVSLGVSAGGFYRLSDFSITADLGYEKVWDFGNNAAINDYALGLRAGLSYSVLSWFAVSAGAGVNYSIFKDSNFEDGKFIPMIFGGFEFNLIK
jgi:hypothetical protein